MTMYQILATLGKPIAYGYHSKPVTVPYLVLLGAGQDQFEADNTYYVTADKYRLEYYFKKKDPDFEGQIEALLLSNGFKYEKSEDIYIDAEDVFEIYYTF